MPTSHGVIQGYNAQALVDAKRQIILHAQAFSSQDHENLAPIMAAAQKNMRTIGKGADYFNGKQLSADSNYFSLANLVFCQDQNFDAYIPDLQFRKRDERLSRQQRFKNGIHSRKRSTHKEGIFSPTDFVFDNARQGYICPQGHLLKRGARNQRNRYRVYDIYRADQADCASCPLRRKCLSRPDTPRRFLSIEVVPQSPSLIEKMKAKIDALPGRQIYARRLAIVEPVFANIRIQKRLDRFTLRTKAKVDVQWKLFAVVHNIGKIHQYGMTSDRKALNN